MGYFLYHVVQLLNVGKRLQGWHWPSGCVVRRKVYPFLPEQTPDTDVANRSVARARHSLTDRGRHRRTDDVLFLGRDYPFFHGAGILGVDFILYLLTTRRNWKTKRIWCGRRELHVTIPAACWNSSKMS